jgi:XTP/dITP diphosphohydrolase
MKKITLISGNENKIREISLILKKYDIELEAFDLDIYEIQADNLEEIALYCARQAFQILKKPLIIEDSGLFIEALKGFPGPYTSYAYKTIGNEGIIKLMKDEKNRKATFKTVIAYKDQIIEKIFTGEVEGKISENIKGLGWGFDPIFIPQNHFKTYGEMSVEEKNEISHRSKAVSKFAEWYSNLS